MQAHCSWTQKWQRRLRMHQAVVLPLTVMFLLAPCRTAAQSTSHGRHSINASTGADMRGRTAPGFSLKTPDGKLVSLAAFKGRPVLVNFWATWCPPCMREMPWLAALQHKYAAQGFAVIGISEDIASAPRVTVLTHLLGVDYPVALDDHSAAEAYGVRPLPASFYIGRDGKILIQTVGQVDRETIENNVRRTVAYRPNGRRK